jgi:phage terminase Nu1 subunit (DNA packaging protein)
MTSFWEHLMWAVFTLIMVPMIIWYGQRRIDKREAEKAKMLEDKDAERARLLKERDDARELALKTKEEAKKEVDMQWHDSVTQKIENIGTEVKGALNTSSQDRQNLWKSLYAHGHQVDCKSDTCRIETRSITFPIGK